MGQARWKHWEIIWDYMRYLWDIYEIFMGYLWDIYGIICQVMVIFFNGIQWRNQWDLRKKRWSNDFILDYMILYGGFQTLGCPRNHPVISWRRDLVLKHVETGDDWGSLSMETSMDATIWRFFSVQSFESWIFFDQHVGCVWIWRCWKTGSTWLWWLHFWRNPKNWDNHQKIIRYYDFYSSTLWEHVGIWPSTVGILVLELVYGKIKRKAHVRIVKPMAASVPLHQSKE